MVWILRRYCGSRFPHIVCVIRDKTFKRSGMTTSMVYILFSIFILCRGVTCDLMNLRIVNGSEADYPYQVCIQKNKNIHCGGIIVDKFHIVTAAHCVYRINLKELSIVVGSNDLRYSGARFPIQDVKIHEHYEHGNGWPNDIALLRLAIPLLFNEYVAPANLPQRGHFWSSLQPAVISGYGQTNHNSSASPRLLKTIVFIENRIACQQAYPEYRIRSTQICTINRDKITGSCKGDSGSPLTINGQIVGLVSFSREHGCAGQAMLPQVHTRISKYIEWINLNRRA